VSEAWAWLAQYAEKHALRYEPDEDESWFRAFEPFVTLRTPLGYGHALHATGNKGSMSIGRMIVPSDPGDPDSRPAGAWIAFVQDVRLDSVRAAATNDLRSPSPFAESPDLVALPRRRTGDGAFDRAFASFGPSDADVGRALGPSVRKLALSWRVPLHIDVRPGAFILAPVSLPADPGSLAWLHGAVQFFGEKAAVRVK
jgi:hypothetical protein